MKVVKKRLDRLKLLDGNICFYCGKQDSNLTVDHFYPLSRGGSDIDRNCVLACFKCNHEKGNKKPDIKMIEKFEYHMSKRLEKLHFRRYGTITERKE